MRWGPLRSATSARLSGRRYGDSSARDAARVFTLYKRPDNSYQVCSIGGGKTRRPIFTEGDVVLAMHSETYGWYLCRVAGFERLSSASNFGAVGSIGMKLVTCSRDPKAHPHPFHYHRKNAEPLAAHLWLSASTVCTTRVT